MSLPFSEPRFTRDYYARLIGELDAKINGLLDERLRLMKQCDAAEA